MLGSWVGIQRRQEGGEVSCIPRTGKRRFRLEINMIGGNMSMWSGARAVIATILSKRKLATAFATPGGSRPS